jgi:hypothetical protein
MVITLYHIIPQLINKLKQCRNKKTVNPNKVVNLENNEPTDDSKASISAEYSVND